MIACVRLPHFAAAIEEREHSNLSNARFVLVDDTPKGPVVCGVSRLALKEGVRAGMNLAQVRAQCADVVVRGAVHSRYARIFDNLLGALTTFTEKVEPEDGLELRADSRHWRNVTFLHPSQLDDYPAATCYLDLGKLSKTEIPDLTRQLYRFVWDQMGFPAKLGLSSGKFPARVVATSVNTGEMLVIPQGREADFLAAYTVALLPVDGETLRQLDLLGWHTLGDVAMQPVAALLNRFGKQGRIMHRLANGRDTSPVQIYIPPVMVHINRQLDGPVTDWGRIQAVMADMMAAAALQGQTVQHIALVLVLDDGLALERQLMLRQPSGNLRHLQETVLDMAQSLVVTGGVSEIDMMLRDISPAIPRQLSLFDRPAVPQAHLNTVLKNLMAHYGDEQFYWVRAAKRDARLPERRYRWQKAEKS